MTPQEAIEWLEKAKGNREALEMAKELLRRLEWHTMDEHPEDGEACVVKIYGSDIVLPQEGETIEDAIARTMRETEDNAHTEIAVWYDCDGEFVSELGFPLVVQPKYWKRIDR